MGAEATVLTRALKRGGSPCVASRFLLRLEALSGKAWDACRTRGRVTLELARRLDRDAESGGADRRARARLRRSRYARAASA